MAFLIVVYMGLGVGMTRMNFLYILGTMMAPQAPERAAYTIGFAAHMMASAGFGIAHTGLLHALWGLEASGPPEEGRSQARCGTRPRTRGLSPGVHRSREEGCPDRRTWALRTAADRFRCAR